MEDVIQTYMLPYDPKRPVVCFDEASKQLFGEVRPPQPCQAGQPARADYEYQRKGVCNQFMMGEPLRGWRHVRVTARRTRLDYAECVRELVEGHYPHAQKVRLVQDNLNTHSGGSLYEAYLPAVARRILDKVEWHYTPKHGSWLNVAEMELSVLARRCLDRRIPDIETLRREVAAWQRTRNAQEVKVDWQFTTADARVKLKKLYPTVQLQ